MQVSLLHLYHHSIVPVLGWYYIWYVFSVPAINLFALLNSTVHVIMYSYYALASLGPHLQPYLWWKKYITQIQVRAITSSCTLSLEFGFSSALIPVLPLSFSL